MRATDGFPKDTDVISHTQNWLERIVIGRGLCPFARRDFEARRIDYAVIKHSGLQHQLGHILSAFDALARDNSFETSLLIFPRGLEDFGEYLDMLNSAQGLLLEAGYEGIFQIASFHPQYCFDGVSPQDASNYTNRSPYPIVHILREASVAAVLRTYPDPENIPARNIKLMRGLGVEAAEKALQDCQP